MSAPLRLAAAVSILLHFGCSPASVSGPTARHAAEPPASAADVLIEELARQSIADRFVAGDIPDIELLPDRKRVLISSETKVARNAVRLGPSALPKMSKSTFELVSAAEIRAIADQTGRNVYFVRLYDVSIKGDDGIVSLGVDFVRPSQSRDIKTCCCIRWAHYRREQGEWRFKEWTPVRVCS